MPKIPEACPHCGHTELMVQVKAWAVYKRGQYYTLDVTEAIDDSDATEAVCEKCNEEIPL